MPRWYLYRHISLSGAQRATTAQHISVKPLEQPQSVENPIHEQETQIKSSCPHIYMYVLLVRKWTFSNENKRLKKNGQKLMSASKNKGMLPWDYSSQGLDRKALFDSICWFLSKNSVCIRYSIFLSWQRKSVQYIYCLWVFSLSLEWTENQIVVRITSA